MRYPFVVALALVWSLGASAAEVSFDQAMESYLVGTDEQAPTHEAANERANEAFAQLLAADPANPLYMSYLGSTWTLKARDAWTPWKKMQHAEKGLALLDKSLTLLGPEHDKARCNSLPVSACVRGTAAISFVNLPDQYFKRLGQGHAILQELADAPALREVPGPAKAYLYYYAGEAARLLEKPEQARSRYLAATEMAPGTPYATRAQQALAQLKN